MRRILSVRIAARQSQRRLEHAASYISTPSHPSFSVAGSPLPSSAFMSKDWEGIQSPNGTVYDIDPRLVRNQFRVGPKKKVESV